MIHFAVGTKSQLIKTTPVMKCLEKRGVPYHYIDFGQHSKTTSRLRSVFGLKEPDTFLCLSNSNVTNLGEATRWLVSVFSKILGKKEEIFREIFKGKQGVCIIHGDTVSTLLGLVAAKRAGLKVCHLEAGLRSKNPLHPFPEEILRLICMKYSDHLAAPSDWAQKNLVSMGYGTKTFKIPGNTGFEAVSDNLNLASQNEKEEEPFALFSIHRFETIMSKRRLSSLVDLINGVTSQIPVKFVLHEPTKHRLHHFGLMETLRESEVKLLPGLDYPDFLRLVSESEFVVTDGGSIQEECSYLGKPCLLFRKKTERMDGLGENVLLSGFESKKLFDFVKGYAKYRRDPGSLKIRPSDAVADFLISKGYVCSQ